MIQSVPVTVPVTEPLEMVEEPTEPDEGYIPSNETDYDRQWLLGCETMGWRFGDWMFKLGGAEVSRPAF